MSNASEFSVALLVIAGGLLFGCTKAPVVSYQADVKPVLDSNCLACHRPGADGYEASGLRLDSYEGLMRGTRFGPVVVPGDSLTSALNILIEGRADPSIAMPHDQRKLREEDIAVVKAWVDQGAKNN